MPITPTTLYYAYSALEPCEVDGAVELAHISASLRMAVPKRPRSTVTLLNIVVLGLERGLESRDAVNSLKLQNNGIEDTIEQKGAAINWQNYA